MIVDAHHHFWTLSRGDYGWLTKEFGPIYRDFAPADLHPLKAAAGVDRTVLVQAADTVAETEFLLKLAEQTPYVGAVVGWVDLAAADAIATIDRLASNPLLKGLRPMLQDIKETDWILRDEVAPALAHIASLGLRFDALVQPRHLPALLEIARRHSTLKIVIDHIAKPPMGKGRKPEQDWRTGMQALAGQPNVWCKLSGMVTEVEGTWSIGDIAPFALDVLSCFPADKLMFGSDWPVLNLKSDYKTWADTARTLIAPLSPEDQTAILGKSAADFYDLA